jgi:hypothetical protein
MVAAAWLDMLKEPSISARAASQVARLIID